MNKYLILAATVGAFAIAAPAYLSVAQADMHGMHAEEAVEMSEHMLEDGTKVLIKGEDVFVLDAEGNETTAPDGVHTLEDGSTITVEGGKLAADVEMDHEGHMDDEHHEEHMDEKTQY